MYPTLMRERLVASSRRPRRQARRDQQDGRPVRSARNSPWTRCWAPAPASSSGGRVRDRGHPGPRDLQSDPDCSSRRRMASTDSTSWVAPGPAHPGRRHREGACAAPDQRRDRSSISRRPCSAKACGDRLLTILFPDLTREQIDKAAVDLSFASDAIAMGPHHLSVVRLAGRPSVPAEMAFSLARANSCSDASALVPFQAFW